MSECFGDWMLLCRLCPGHREGLDDNVGKTGLKGHCGEALDALESFAGT